MHGIQFRQGRSGTASPKRQSFLRKCGISSEHQHVVQYTRRSKFQDQERAYFESLIATVRDGDTWKLTPIANQDEEDLTEEQRDQSCLSALATTNSGDPPQSSTHSSPLSKEELAKSSNVLGVLSRGEQFNTDLFLRMMNNAKENMYQARCSFKLFLKHLAELPGPEEQPEGQGLLEETTKNPFL
jgi:hypothetical protein